MALRRLSCVVSWGEVCDWSTWNSDRSHQSGQKTRKDPALTIFYRLASFDKLLDNLHRAIPSYRTDTTLIVSAPITHQNAVFVGTICSSRENSAEPNWVAEFLLTLWWLDTLVFHKDFECSIENSFFELTKVPVTRMTIPRSNMDHCMVAWLLSAKLAQN